MPVLLVIAEAMVAREAWLQLPDGQCARRAMHAEHMLRPRRLPLV